MTNLKAHRSLDWVKIKIYITYNKQPTCQKILCNFTCLCVTILMFLK